MSTRGNAYLLNETLLIDRYDRWIALLCVFVRLFNLLLDYCCWKLENDCFLKSKTQ